MDVYNNANNPAPSRARSELDDNIDTLLPSLRNALLMCIGVYDAECGGSVAKRYENRVTCEAHSRLINDELSLMQLAVTVGLRCRCLSRSRLVQTLTDLDTAIAQFTHGGARRDRDELVRAYVTAIHTYKHVLPTRQRALVDDADKAAKSVVAAAATASQPQQSVTPPLSNDV